MEYERSSIFRVELVIKSVLFGSSGTNFKHMKVKNILSLRLVKSQKYNGTFQ